MTDYVFRHIKDSQFQIAKFEDGADTPADTYVLVYNKHTQTCTCPSYKQPCKHVGWLDLWLKLDDPSSSYYNDAEGEFQEHNFGAPFDVEAFIEAHLT